MMNIVIFGAPGSGKGTQSEKLIEKYGLYHISTGDLLRQEIKAGSELGKIADGYISKGQLLPDSLIIDMLAKLLDTTHARALSSTVSPAPFRKPKLSKPFCATVAWNSRLSWVSKSTSPS